MRVVIGSVLFVVLSLYSLAEAFEVPVNVAEPAGIARKAEPVSGGIALPAGMFKPGTVELGLFDGDKSIPVQASELVVGPKGFVRWVLLDFQLDLKANEIKKLMLKTGRPAIPNRSLKVIESTNLVRIDTGRVAFEVSRNKPFGLLENVIVNGNAIVNSGRISYIDGNLDKQYFADVPSLVNLHYDGPMRVTIEVRGKFIDDKTAQLGYCTYITAWAGRSDVLVRHSLINSHQDRRYFVKVKSSRIELKPAKTGEKIVVGADKPIAVNSGGEISLHQGLEEERNRELASVKLMQDGSELWSGRDAMGWISCGSLWIADRLFRTDPPRLLGVSSNGTLILDAADKLFEGQEKEQTIVGRPYACQDDYRWLYDCSAHRSEYRIDFDATDDGIELAEKANTAAARVWAVASGQWYSRCNVLAVGRFGTLADEIACHKKWGWIAGSEPDRQPNPWRFVGYEDNHYESEADSAEGLLLMFLRTGKRGFFDEAEAWVRYHTDVQSWRTEGWQWKDGGIWFPQGGPPGNRPVRGKANLKYANWNKGTNVDRTLWRLAMAKSCYCHFYGAGLVDWFCLTGDREALQAAVDNCETKWDEFTHFRNFTPGKSNIASTRGFGRGFYVAVRTWMVQPNNPVLQKLVNLCRYTFVNLPEEYLDERGVYAVVANKYPKTYLTDGIKEYMGKNDITVDDSGTFRDGSGNSWKWRDIGGTWMIAYIHSACNMLAEQTSDEDLTDYVIASGHFTAKYMLSPVAKQTWYYTALDIPRKGDIWDGWKYDGQQRNEFGEGPKHSGWYTRFFPDCCVQAYCCTGEKYLLEKAREFWSFGNRRRYQTTKLMQKHNFATHNPPKDDSVLSTVRLFYEYSHPKKDTEPPTAIKDLTVKRLGGSRAVISFTAPADIGGRVARYQVKVAKTPILPYEKWDYSRDSGVKRNWWRAINCKGESGPKSAGSREKFTVTNVPDAADQPLYFAARSFDDSSNRSAISNVFKATYGE
ncbi:MAG: hypothetical protein ACYSU3_05930 [Planctomycetota bacterium]|jgi:hypothetical protein